MNGGKFIDALKKSLRITSDIDLKKKTGLSIMTIHNWRQRTLTPQMVASVVRRLAQERVMGDVVVEKSRKKLKTESLADLAHKLGVTNQAIQNWKSNGAVTARQVVGLISSAREAVEQETHQNAVRPLVEFFRITKSKQDVGYSLFSIKHGDSGKLHPYLSGLKDELEKHHGVYVFFDSRGQAIYSGKARKQKLWKEMNLVFNRKRDSLQKIRRVKHPSRKQTYRTAQEKSRQITEYSVPLHELAHYFSAYSVVDGMVDVVESLLVRSFANDLLNKRMEKFGKKSTA